MKIKKITKFTILLLSIYFLISSVAFASFFGLISATASEPVTYAFTGFGLVSLATILRRVKKKKT